MAYMLITQVRNMCNVLEEQGGLVHVDQAQGSQRLTSELLPHIESRRGVQSKAIRPATPLKKSGDRSRRRDRSNRGIASDAGSQASGSPLPRLAGAAAPCRLEDVELWEGPSSS